MKKCKGEHVWDRYWHMGSVIGRECTLCSKVELMPGDWCRVQHDAANKQVEKFWSGAKED